MATESTATFEKRVLSCDESSQDSILEELNLPTDILSADPMADASDLQDTLKHLLHWTDWRPAQLSIIGNLPQA